MKKILSEDDIRIIDNRGKYRISKWVVWAVIVAGVLVGTLFIVRLAMQARFIAELTSGSTVVEKPSATFTNKKINIVELNGARVYLRLGKAKVRLLYCFVGLTPDAVSASPREDLKQSYIDFKRDVGTNKLTEFTYPPVNAKVEYKDGEAWRYTFTNSYNSYSMTVICPYSDLVALLDGIVK